MEGEVSYLYERLKEKNSAETLGQVRDGLKDLLQKGNKPEEGKALTAEERYDLVSLISGIGCYLQLVSYKGFDRLTFREFYESNKDLCEKSIKPLIKAKEKYSIEF